MRAVDVVYDTSDGLNAHLYSRAKISPGRWISLQNSAQVARHVYRIYFVLISITKSKLLLTWQFIYSLSQCKILNCNITHVFNSTNSYIFTICGTLVTRFIVRIQ